ncbi:MAG: hypothetical protein NUW37_05060 [Planctomycetes bacterium]|nr:hypothetical protein [Planctomycetota bacterium]
MTQSGTFLQGAPQPDDGTNSGSGTISGNVVSYELHTVNGPDNADSVFEGSVTIDGSLCFSYSTNEVCLLEGTYTGSGTHYYTVTFPNGETVRKADRCTWSGEFTAYRVPRPESFQFSATSGTRSASSGGKLDVCPCSSITLAQSFLLPVLGNDSLESALLESLNFQGSGMSEVSPGFDEVSVTPSGWMNVRDEYNVTGAGSFSAVSAIVDGVSLSTHIDVRVPDALRIVRSLIRDEDSLPGQELTDVEEFIEIPKDEFVFLAAFPAWTGPDGILNPFGTGDDLDCVDNVVFGDGGFDVELQSSTPRRGLLSISSGVWNVMGDSFTVVAISAEKKGEGTLFISSLSQCSAIPPLQRLIRIFVGNPLFVADCSDIGNETSLIGCPIVCQGEARWTYKTKFFDTKDPTALIQIVKLKYTVTFEFHSGGNLFSAESFNSVREEGFLNNIRTNQVRVNGNQALYTATTDAAGLSFYEIDIVATLRDIPEFKNFGASVTVSVRVDQVDLIHNRVQCQLDLAGRPKEQIYTSIFRDEVKISLCLIVLRNEPNRFDRHVGMGGLSVQSDLFKYLFDLVPGSDPNNPEYRIIQAHRREIEDSINEIWRKVCVIFEIRSIVHLKLTRADENQIIDANGTAHILVSNPEDSTGPLDTNTNGASYLLDRATYNDDDEYGRAGQQFELPSVLAKHGTVRDGEDVSNVTIPGCIPIFIMNSVQSSSRFIDPNNPNPVNHTLGIGLTNYSSRDNSELEIVNGEVREGNLPFPVTGNPEPRTGVFIGANAFDPGDAGQLPKVFAHELGHIFIGAGHRSDSIMARDVALLTNSIPCDIFEPMGLISQIKAITGE